MEGTEKNHKEEGQSGGGRLEDRDRSSLGVKIAKPLGRRTDQQENAREKSQARNNTRSERSCWEGGAHQ